MRLAAQGVILVSILALMSCVSGPSKPTTLSQELPPDLPKEIRERFDAKEAALVDDSGTSREPAAAPAVKRSHKRRRIKLKDAAFDDPAPAMIFPLRKSELDPIWIGEKLTYAISYIGIVAGEVVLEVLPLKVMHGRKVYHVRAHASSSPVFSLIYKLNDTLESFIDFEGIFSYRFHMVLEDKKQQRDSLELYDSEKKETFYWSRWEYADQSKKQVKETTPIQPFSQDSLSSLFFLRTVPFAADSVVQFPVVSEGKSQEASCTVVRREKVRSPMGDVFAWVVRPELKSEGLLKKGGDSFIWFTDDDRRFPVKLEARVRIGSISAELIKIEPGSAPNRVNASVQH
jgi:hypothetical protein